MAWTKEVILTVWQKGEVVTNYDSTKHRKDDCNAWIQFDKYGDRNSIYGWEIDHISPGGSDTLSNLRPLQWKNNVDKNDGRLKCNVISERNTNKEV